MKALVERRVFLLQLLLCAAGFPALAALLLCFYPENPMFFFLASSFCVAASVLTLCRRYLQRRDQILEDAALQIEDYILDRRKGGVECSEEGPIYHLLHQVNSLVTIADARADSERQAKEFLRDTISDISHQLKTPIAALNIYNGIIQQEAADTAAVHEFSSLSEKELDRMESLVQNLLKMARLEAGAVSLERSPENISELLERVRQRYSFRAEQEGKEIALEGDDQSLLLCDPVWLAEAMGNLVKNALDHTKRGDRILIRWKQSPCFTQILVADTGNGIHPQDLYHIFKRFYRSRFSRDTQGVGLGLPLAKSIVEAHQGSIEVHSHLGRGTTFTVNFPNMPESSI